MSFESNLNESRSNPWMTMGLGNGYVERDEKKKKNWWDKRSTIILRSHATNSDTTPYKRFQGRCVASGQWSGSPCTGGCSGHVPFATEHSFPMWTMAHSPGAFRAFLCLTRWRNVALCARELCICVFLFSTNPIFTLGGKRGPVSTINHNSVAFSFLKTKGRRENRFAKITGSFWNDVSCTKRIHISQGKEVQNHPPSHLRDSHRRGSRFAPSMNS